MRTRLRQLVGTPPRRCHRAAALPSATAADAAQAGGAPHRPPAAACPPSIRYTEYGVPHIVAKDYANLGFGTGWAQAADQVCVLADGFVTVRGERSRHFGPDAAPDFSLSSATTNLSSDLYFRGVRDAGTVRATAGPARTAGPEPRGQGPDARLGGRLQRVAEAEPGHRPGLRGRRLGAAGHHARRGLPRRTPSRFSAGRDGSWTTITAARPPAVRHGSRHAAGPAAAAPDAKTAARAAAELFDAANADMGSNAVAFGGATTANGRGLLLGNPHYPWQGGRRFWQSQQTIPGELNVSGGSLLGIADRQHRVQREGGVEPHRRDRRPREPPPADAGPGRPDHVSGGRRAGADDEADRDRRVKDGAPVTRTQWWTRYGPVVTSLGADLPLPWTADDRVRPQRPQRGEPARLPDTALALRQGASARRTSSSALARAPGPALGEHRGRRLRGAHPVHPVPGAPPDHRRPRRRAARRRWAGPRIRRRASRSWTARAPTARSARTPDAVQPGIFGPAKMPTLKDAPYAENSNDSAWLANADRPLTGYERVFGNVGTPRSLRTRGAVEDVAAMADRGGLTVARPPAAAVREPGARGGSRRRRRGAGVCRAARRYGDGQ